jgi:hypothetical protein
MFARYVILHFRGHTAGYHDEWRRIQAANANGGFTLGDPGQPSNLAVYVGSK